MSNAGYGELPTLLRVKESALEGEEDDDDSNQSTNREWVRAHGMLYIPIKIWELTLDGGVRAVGWECRSVATGCTTDVNGARLRWYYDEVEAHYAEA